MSKINNSNLPSDAKHAITHNNKIVEEEGYLNLDKAHKDWYEHSELGKQRSKPKSVPKQSKKIKKQWKDK